VNIELCLKESRTQDYDFEKGTLTHQIAPDSRVDFKTLTRIGRGFCRPFFTQRGEFYSPAGML